MHKTLACSLLGLLIHGAIARAGGGSAFPAATPAPRIAMAVALDDQTIQLSYQVIEHRLQQQTKMVPATVVVDGKEETVQKPVSFTVRIPVYKAVVARVTGDDYRVFDLAGNRVPLQTYKELLKKPAAVLFSNNGKLLDPFYANLYRKDLLIIYIRPNVQLGGSAPPPTPRPTPERAAPAAPPEPPMPPQ